MLLDAIGFLICAGIIFICGRLLSIYGEVISRKSGLGQGWIGLILMASVTSLPELFVGISSSGILQSVDLAAGDVLGSCAFNLAILALLDWVGSVPLSNRASSSHILSGALSIILLAMVGLGLFLPNDIVVLKWVGLLSIGFIVVYLVSMYILYKYQLRERGLAPAATEERSSDYTMKKAVLLYALNAVIVVACALFLPHFADGIAVKTGLGSSFVGTLFLAVSTSLPEIAVSIAAVRMGFTDLAIGNLFGSNIFNILILSIDDIFYTKGNLLKDASDSHIISVFAVIIMTAIAIAGLQYRPPKKHWFLTWDALLILLVYIGNIILLYHLNH